MEDKLIIILNILKSEFDQRQELITDNKKDINGPFVSSEMADVKMELDDLNRELIRLNEGNQELQDSIKKYIKNYIRYPIMLGDSITYEKCFQLTISGDMKYSIDNPFFTDDNFYNDMIKYFVQKEDYIRCKMIKFQRYGEV